MSGFKPSVMDWVVFGLMTRIERVLGGAMIGWGPVYYVCRIFPRSLCLIVYCLVVSRNERGQSSIEVDIIRWMSNNELNPPSFSLSILRVLRRGASQPCGKAHTGFRDYRWADREPGCHLRGSIPKRRA